jgi:ABC-type transport system substrate-binding protein
MKSLLPAVALLILLVGLLAACLSPVTIAPDTPRSLEGNILVLAGGAQDPPEIDPALANDASSTFVIRQIFSGLVTLDQDLQVIPDLAEGWKTSSSGQVYTFTLRPEARFHDGRPVTAEDFVYSLERACDPNLSSYLPCGTYLNDIVGVSAKLAGQADQITGLRAVDDHTLVITIDAPKSYFLSKLTYNTAYVVDRDNVASGGNWTEQPNGTGPFILDEWRHNRRIVLVRNEDYYRDAPLLDEAILLLGADASQPLVLYEQGEIDFTEVGTSVVARLEYEGSPMAGELRVTPELSLSYIGFNSQIPPFDDPKVRQALTMAVDRDKIARVTYEGRLEQARGIVPPAMPGYMADLEGLDYDPEQARQLLAESRYGGPESLPRITMYTTGGPIPTLLQEVYRRELGIEIELRQVEWADYLLGLDNRRYPMFMLSWIADYPDPQNFLEVLFYSTSPNNYTDYRNEEVDRLLAQAAVEQDPARRMELYQEVEQRLVTDAPIMPLNHGISYSLTKPYVKGLEVTPVGLQDLSTIYFEDR